MGSTIIRTSPMQGNLSGDGPYKEKKVIAASPRSGGAKIELIDYSKKKSSGKPPKFVRRASENDQTSRRLEADKAKFANKPPKGDQKIRTKKASQTLTKAKQSASTKSESEILCEIATLDQRMNNLIEERNKVWLSIRKRQAATELFHKLRDKKLLLTQQL